MEDSSFGVHLRREREQRGVSLEAISAATRISIRVLEGFENEKWDRLPGGFFNRGFLRSIARYLQIGEEELLAAYAAAANDSPEARAAAAAEIPDGHSNLILISVGALLLAAALGLKLGRVIKATTVSEVRPMPLTQYQGLAMAARAATPIEPGEMTLPPTVPLTYEIE